MTNPNVCSKCIGNTKYKAWFSNGGVTGQCEIDQSHGRRSKVLSAEVLAERVDEFFRENFATGTDEPYVTEYSDNLSYQQRGQPYDEIMMDELQCDEVLVRAIEPYLPDASNHDLSQGDETFYDDTQLYEGIAAIDQREQLREEEYWYENRFSIQWEGFCDTVINKQRFFNVTRHLDKLFGKSKEFETGEISPIYQLASDTRLFRVRLKSEGLTSTALSRHPAKELGPPPNDKARPGRMNVEFIPVFYAAFDEETAITEVRPSFEDEIAIGEFTTLRQLKVFDFTVFSRPLGDKLHQAIAHTRYDFISQLESEISKPIRASDKAREYIPTQIVAEHIRERFGCDGIIYKSSMNKNRKHDSRNIILFDKRQPFLDGKQAALRFVHHKVKTVRDIKYTVEPDYF
jgi:RES domain